jgi:hypothetical protein
MDYKNDPGRWSLVDLKQCLENGDGPLYDHLMSISELIEQEKSSNFILAKVIIENDLDDEDADEIDVADNDE